MSVHRGGRGFGHLSRTNGPATGVGGGTFAPSSLYGGGDIGNAWDPTDLTHVWQSIAGTTGGAFASPAGRVDDISGKGNHWNARADDSGRPTLASTNNGLLTFAGVQILVSAATGFYNASAFTWIGAVKAANQSNIWWAEVNSTLSPPVYAPGLRGSGAGGAVLNEQRNNASAQIANSIAVTLLDGAIHIVAITDDGTHVKVSVDGGAFVTDTYVRNSPLTVDRSSLGCAWVGNATIFAGYTGSVGAGLAIGRVLAGTLSAGGGEITNAYNWVAGKHGLTTL